MGTAKKYHMLGLNTDPSTDAHYKSLDYCIYTHINGSAYVYENGSGKTTLGTYGVGTQFTITYDNSVVRYYINGSLKRSVSAGSNKRFYFDSSLLSVHSTPVTTSLFFAPMGMVGTKRFTRSNGAKGQKGAGVGQKGATGSGSKGQKGATGSGQKGQKGASLEQVVHL